MAHSEQPPSSPTESSVAHHRKKRKHYAMDGDTTETTQSISSRKKKRNAAETRPVDIEALEDPVRRKREAKRTARAGKKSEGAHNHVAEGAERENGSAGEDQVFSKAATAMGEPPAPKEDFKNGHNLKQATSEHQPSRKRRRKSSGVKASLKVEKEEERGEQEGFQSPHPEEATAQPSDKQNARFIIFIGNLPYETTTDSLHSHFSAIKPDSVRHITQKQDASKSGKRRGKSSKEKAEGKSKGFAFLEFSSFDRMRTCLKLYHHSWFAADGSFAPP